MSTMQQHSEMARHLVSSIRSDPLSARLAGCSKLIVATAEHVGATLLVLEIFLLSAAVVARYVLSMPLIWSDELAELMIIWQAMLGAVVAFHKGQHLSLTVLARNVSSQKQVFLETVGLLLTVLLCVPLAFFAYAHALADFDLITPALEISPSWRSGALVVGLGLIALLACMALIQRARMTSDFVLAVVLVVGLVCALYFARNQFIGLGHANLLIFFVGLGGACMLAGVPIAFAFGLAAAAYVLLATQAPLSIVPVRMEAGMAHILLLSVPLFIALGAMLEITGMARRMVEFLAAMVGHVKGGLSYVLVGGMVLVSGISGSKAADMAAIAPVLLPEMKRRGAKDGDMIALLAGSSAASETIPPSLILIMTGAVTGVSIGALFTAGWLPAIVLSLMICVLARFRAARSETGAMERASWKTARMLAVSAIPVLILPFLIRSAVVEGVATATEVATIGLAYVLVVTLVLQRSFDWRLFYRVAEGGIHSHGRDLHYPGNRKRDGMGLRSVRPFIGAIGYGPIVAGRHVWLPSGLDRSLCRPGKCAGRNSRDRAARTAALSGGEGPGHFGGALCDRRRDGDGRGTFRATFRRRLLHRLRDRTRQSGRRDEGDMAIPRRGHCRRRAGRFHPVADNRIPELGIG